MSMTIYQNGRISLDGNSTGLGVSQEKEGTNVFVCERLGGGYRRVEMPHKRYSLAADKPLSGAPGRAQFERDIRAMLAKA